MNARNAPARVPAGAQIVLATINARYLHASLGLRYLMANLGPLRERARILEFTSGARTEAIVERLLEERPKIVGLGVYIWNVDESTRVAAMLGCVAPEVVLVVGGPEVSHELEQQRIVALARHVVTGPADLEFARLCARLLAGEAAPRVIAAEPPDPAALELPYRLYDAEDVANRQVYVEASRGCPFRCEFCLSALDRSAWPFDTGRVLGELAALHARGARSFKFVDRTFNLKVATSLALLGFFADLERRAPDDPVFAHFELVPDRLPEALREAIAAFGPGRLQFEIGIQTWNPEVQALIGRRQDNALAEANLGWLRTHTRVHLHVDLIAGLPGEDLASFAAGFDRLHALAPHEIQVGILKRLRGAPIARHTERFGMRYNPDPPYNVLATDRLDFATLQRLARFARYWDLYGNSGRFARTAALLAGERPFERFMAFADWLYAQTDATLRLSLERQRALLRRWLVEVDAVDPAGVDQALADDARPSPGDARQARQLRHHGAAAPAQVG